MTLAKRIYLYIYRLAKGNVKLAKKIGVNIGNECRLIGKVNFGSEPYLIKLGDRVSITDSTFATHDGGVWVFRREYPSIDIIAPITIGDNVFIGAKCIVLPGVTIGNNVVVGAGSVVTKDLPADAVYAGVPVRKIKSIEEYKADCLASSLDTKNIQDKKLYLQTLFPM